MSKIKDPSAKQLTAANLKGFFNSAGAFRSGPRTMPINTSAPSHSTGVLRNHSCGMRATESPIGTKTRIKLKCVRVPSLQGYNVAHLGPWPLDYEVDAGRSGGYRSAKDARICGRLFRRDCLAFFWGARLLSSLARQASILRNSTPQSPNTKPPFPSLLRLWLNRRLSAGLGIELVDFAS